MRIKKGANYVLMELGGRKETEISYTIEAPLRGFYTIGPVCVRVQDAFGLFHNEREIQLYDDFLVFPKMEDIKDALIKSRVPKIFTGAVNIRNPGEGTNFYNLREYIPIGAPFSEMLVGIDIIGQLTKERHPHIINHESSLLAIF